MMEKIKNVLFDLGGVIIDLDVNKTTQQMLKLLGLEDQYKEVSVLTHPVFKQYETGDINSQEFVQTLKEMAQTKVEKQQIIDAWNAMLLYIPENRVKLLEKLMLKNRLFVLSNTNEIHIQQFNTMVPGYSTLSELFERVYYSNEIGYRKPTKDSFQTVMNSSSINPVETLFIDDSLENIATASKLKFQTLHIDKDNDVVGLLTKKYPTLF